MMAVMAHRLGGGGEHEAQADARQGRAADASEGRAGGARRRPDAGGGGRGRHAVLPDHPRSDAGPGHLRRRCATRPMHAAAASALGANGRLYTVISQAACGDIISSCLLPPGLLTAASCRAGHTYEREAIEQWLITHSTSPLTNEELRHKTLTPNYMVRGLIQRFGPKTRAAPVDIAV